MNRKPLVAGVVVSLLVLGAFELLLATTHPSLEMPRVEQASTEKFIRSWEGYWFKYGIGTKGIAHSMREFFERTYRHKPAFGAETEWNRKLTPAELEVKLQEEVAYLAPRLRAVQLWAVLAWPVGWLAFGLAWLVAWLANANARSTQRMMEEGRMRSARNNSTLSLMLFAAAGAVLVAAVGFPVVMVQGDVPSGLMSAPAIAGWITVWQLRRNHRASTSARSTGFTRGSSSSVS